jgi:hypothetical protein
VTDVQSLITLQPNQIGVECRRHRTGQRRLADAGLALEEQRAFQAQRQEQGNSQTLIRDVVRGGEALLQVGDRWRKNGDGAF